MQVELTQSLELGPRQQTQLELHSFLNVLNVLSGDLLLFHDTLGREAFATTLEECYRVSEVFQDNPTVAGILEQFESVRQSFTQEEGLLASQFQELQPAAQQQLANLRSVVSVLNMRHTEMGKRLQNQGSWIPFNACELKAEFEAFLGVVEKNALGRYHIVTNVARKEPKDYLVHLEFSAFHGDTLEMPGVLKDVVRDLLANARKYTNPGGTIEVGLCESERVISLVVQDNGRGIPEDQISQVVEFGFRARNVSATETKGAGFGLTKAYTVCRQYGGRMWIDSEEGQGTTVRIEIPRPSTEA